MSSLLLAVVFGLLIGLILGTIGGGGSILTVPILVYVLGMPAHQATATSLVIVGLTAVAGLLPHMHAGRVDIRRAALVGLAGVPGAMAGTCLNGLVEGWLLLGLFGLVMVGVGLLMLTKRSPARWDEPAWIRGLAPTLVTGFVIGVMTGFFGVGGGFLIVPALTLVLGMAMPVAVGTSLLVIAINSATAILAHGIGNMGDPAIAILFAAGGVAGSLAGGRYGGRLEARWLERGFAGLTVVLGVTLAAANLG